MSCPDFDCKAFVLDELPAPERRRMEDHLKSCAACGQEVDSLSLTMTALRRLPVREIPRRISFVSDPVFEPNWWQRFWNSAPRLGFASAAILSLAILVHAFVPRPTEPAQAPLVAAAPADSEVKIQAEVARRLPAAVDAAVEAKLRTQFLPVVNEMSARLQAFEKQSASQRNADLRDISSAFDVLQRKYNNVYLTAARNGGD